jgi:anaerobic selenocysteine-containing dehydrogenase
VKGDVTNSRSHGYICPKGATLPWFHHSPDNILAPRCNGTETDWTTALNDLGDRLTEIRRTSGPDAIAAYQGNGTVNDSCAVRLVQPMLMALGSSQFYSAATVDVAPAMRAREMVIGTGRFDMMPVWVPEDPASRFVLLLGCNPAVSHGYITIMADPVRKVAAFRQRGGRVWVVDPKVTKTTTLADRHLAIRPGSDAILLAWLVKELLEAGVDREDYVCRTTAPDRMRLAAAVQPFTLEITAQATELVAKDLLDLVGEIRAAGRLAVVAGTGITFSANALVAEWLTYVLLIITGSLDREGGMWFNPGWLTQLETFSEWPPLPPEGFIGPGPKSRPDLPRVLGQYPCAALIDEIEAGHIRALILAGGNPLISIPDPDRFMRAAKLLDVLVAIDIVETPLSSVATHVFPATGQLERMDIVVETRAMLAPSVVSPIAKRRPMWWILSEIARRAGGGDLLSGFDLETATDETILRDIAKNGRDGVDALFAAGPDGLAPPPLYGWVRNKVHTDGRWRIVPPGLAERLPLLYQEAVRAPTTKLQLVAGRLPGRVNGTQYVPPAKSRELPKLHIHPDDAEKFQIREDDHVQVDSGTGQLTASVLLDERMRVGTVWIPHGWSEVNVCRLTSSVGDIDPLTAQPRMSAIPVDISCVRKQSQAC